MTSTGSIVVWACFCSNAADDPDELEAECPGHRRPRIGELIPNMQPGPTRSGHICRQTSCDTHPTPDDHPTTHPEPTDPRRSTT